MRKRVLVCAVLACAMMATTASAQGIPDIARRAGIGGSVGGFFPFDDDVDAGGAVGFNFGMAPQPGLAPTIGFGWYRADLTLAGVSGDREVGQLRVRPLMAGISYTIVTGRIATGLSLNAGISFNSIKLDDAYRTSFGPNAAVQVDASNSFAMRPQVRVEYSLAPKVGLFSSLGYFYTEFDNVIETPAGRFENQWDASSVNLFFGVMVYPLR
jgi:hypothetical protein